MRFLLALTAVAILTAPSSPAEAKEIPGVVIDRSPDPQFVYLGSPAIARLEDGTYVASHDFFGPCAGPGSRTAVFESLDGGLSWAEIAVVQGQFWSSLFTHGGALYLMGTSGGGGQRCVIRRSEDGGRTWTEPDGPETGLLFADTGYHTAPVPVVVHGGRIWRAMEDRHDPGDWAEYFRAFMMSAPVEADLLDASSWTVSNRLSHDETGWTGTGWLEGNAVVTPEGEVVNILRVAGPVPSLFTVETAAVVHVSPDGETASFDPERDFIDFPGGGVKFTIRYDAVSGRYWSLVNAQREPYAMRNRLVLTSSADLRDWTVEAELLEHWDIAYHAWQYVDWLFEGDDIIFVSRTAHPTEEGERPHNYHDANLMTFHRIEGFREYHAWDPVLCFVGAVLP